MPFLKDVDIAQLKTYLQSITECENVEDTHKIAKRALEFLDKFEKKEGSSSQEGSNNLI